MQQRAIQVDADMTYAYTLCGHEYVANEDFEKVKRARGGGGRHWCVFLWLVKMFEC